MRRHESGGHQPAGHQSAGALVVTKTKKKTKITSGLSNGSKSESSILDVNIDPSIGAHVDLGLKAANDLLAGGDSKTPLITSDVLNLGSWIPSLLKGISDIPAKTIEPVGDVLLGEAEKKLEEDPEPIVLSPGHPAAPLDLSKLLGSVLSALPKQ